MRAKAVFRTLAPLALLAAAASPIPAASRAGTAIVNVATCRFELGEPGGRPPSFTVDSNPVVTVVAPEITFTGVTLAVAPPGAVAPGTALVYTLRATNASGIPLTAALLSLPLDPSLGDPVSVGGSPGASPQPSSWSFDPATRTATWTFAAVPAGATVSVQLTAAVSPGTAPDTVVRETGSARAAENPQTVESNTVETPVVPPVLQVVKRADRSSAAPGDPIPFALEVRNVGTFAVAQAVAEDELPPGLAYVAGSGRVDGAPVEPAVGGGGRTLRFALESMDPAQVRTVRLAARVTTTAQEGDVVNRAHAEGVSPGGFAFRSGPSSASVRIVPGVFRREAVLAGRVFVDDDGDGLPGPGEPGVPGVLVVLEDGRGAVTDVTGRWHIEGVRPGLHVVKLDRDTLPPTLKPAVVNADWAGDRGSRFVEARPAALVAVDLPVGPPGAARCRIRAGAVSLDLPTAVVVAEGGKLGAAAEVHLEHAARLIVERGERDPASASVACDAAGGGSREAERVLRERIAARVVELRADRKDPEAAPTDAAGAKDPLEAVVREAPAEAAILAPADGARAPSKSIAVEVIYAAGTVPDLRVDGLPVPRSRIGATSTLPSRGVSASRYVGVALHDGANHLEFRAVPAGSDPGSVAPVAATVVVPGRIAGLRLSAPETRWTADAVTPGAVRVEAVDASGMRVAESPLVTIQADGAEPLGVDADPEKPGWQALLDDGQAVVRFAPRALPGRVRVHAVWDTLDTELFVDVVPVGGQWRVLGLAEARVAGKAGIEGDGGGPPGLGDAPLEDGGRLAVFARGPLGASSRATISVDTARERDRNRLFADFEPDRFFPIYGDTSPGIDESQRQGPVYARVDGPVGFAEYGDVATGLERTELARYDRRLSGVRGRAAFGKGSIEGFAASTEQTVVRDVFAPDGTSGPYLLSRHPVVARSERVILELRDRERTDEVLLRQAKIADVDYDLDPESGTILFRGPVPPFDGSMNPYRVVVLYETLSGGDAQLVAGARAGYRPTDRLEGGISAVHEQRVGADLAIYGADLQWRPAAGTSVRAEVASTDEGNGAATASRVEVQSRPGAKLGWDLSWHDVPVGFANPTLLGAPEVGSRRFGGDVLWEPSAAWRVKGEAFRQEDNASGVERTVAGVDAERRFTGWNLFGGLRSVGSDGPTGSVSSALAEAGIRGKLFGRLLAELSHQQVLGSETAPGYPTRTAAGLAWEIADGQRLVLRQEVESGDGPVRNRTSLGVEGRIGANTKGYSRYELAEGGTASALRSSTGVETVLPLGAGASVSAGIARVETVRGADDGDFTTITAGYEKRYGDALLSTRYEIDLAKAETRHVATASGAFRAGDPWTFFVRERLFVSDPKSGARSAAAEGLLGAAYRPAGSAWQALVRIDHLERGGTAVTAGGVAPGGVPTEPTSAGAPATRPDAAPGIGTGYDRYATEAPGNVALNVAVGAQVTARQRLALTTILRHVGAMEALGVAGEDTYLLGVHYTAQIHPRWTLGWSARRFAQRASGTATYGAGLEGGWLACRNLWLTTGYNVIGFRDPYAPDGDRTDRGAFFSVRFKFDEGSLESLKDLRLDRK